MNHILYITSFADVSREQGVSLLNLSVKSTRTLSPPAYHETAG
jgi:hypothetical protein